MVVMCYAHEVMPLVAVAVVVAVAVLVGNLVTGFATGRVATSITLLAEWNAFDAMLLVILALKCEKIIARHDDDMIAVTLTPVLVLPCSHLLSFLFIVGFKALYWNNGSCHLPQWSAHSEFFVCFKSCAPPLYLTALPSFVVLMLFLFLLLRTTLKVSLFALEGSL